MKQMFVAALVGVGVMGGSMAAAPPLGSSGRPMAEASPSITDYSTYVNSNTLLGFISNRGHLFHDSARQLGRYDGLYYPYSSIDDILGGVNAKTVVFAAGLWMGGIVSADTLISVAEYSTEYTPGSMVAGSFDSAFHDTKYRVYKLYCDSLESNPNTDYLQWPVSQGAPLDRLGHPLSLGCQTSWCCYNDADSSEHTNTAGLTAPLGVEVRQTVWQSGAPADSEKVYARYQLYNKGSNHISGFHVSFWADPDIGGATDDLVGCDTSSNLFFAFNADNSDSVYGTKVPAWGGRILSSPIVPSVGDSALYFGTYRLGYRNIGMTAFSKYVNGTDPSSSANTYNYMKGLNFDGSAYLYNGHVVKYANSGDPVLTTGDCDFNPGDRRLMATCGPINFNPGDSQELVIVFGCARGSDRLQSLFLLRKELQDSRVPTDVPSSEIAALPRAIDLRQNYPNPFNGSTLVEYYLHSPQDVRLEVFNQLGQRVKLLSSAFESVGVHRVGWDGRNDRGQHVASGVYEIRLKSGREQQTVKAVLIN